MKLHTYVVLKKDLHQYVINICMYFSLFFSSRLRKVREIYDFLQSS